MNIIRYAEPEEIESLDFCLYDEENEGAEIIVLERDGAIVAFAQLTGGDIFFLESNAKGAGTAIVNYLKDEMSELVARNVSREAAGYWLHQGFEQGQATGNRPGEYDYVWYAE